MSDRTRPIAAVQRQASAALGEIRQAIGDLVALLRPGRIVDDELLEPMRRVVQGLASVAEFAVEPIVALVEIERKFVDGQRELADQMAAWAQLQHQLAERVAAWADLQRQIANAMDRSLAPVSGAAHVTTRLLKDVAKGGSAGKRRSAGQTATTTKPRTAKRSSPQARRNG